MPGPVSLPIKCEETVEPVSPHPSGSFSAAFLSAGAEIIITPEPALPAEGDNVLWLSKGFRGNCWPTTGMRGPHSACLTW